MGDGKLKEVRTPEKMGVRRSGNSVACFHEVQKCGVESPVVIHALSWNGMCCQDLMQNTVVWRVNSEMIDCYSAASSKSEKDRPEAEGGHQPPEGHDTQIFQLSA